MILPSSQNQNGISRQQESWSLVITPFFFKNSFKDRAKVLLAFFGVLLLAFIISHIHQPEVNQDIDQTDQLEVELIEFNIGTSIRKLVTDDTKLAKVKEGEKLVNGKYVLTEKALSDKDSQINYSKSFEKSDKSGRKYSHNSILINVAYNEKDYLSLPVDYMRKDQHGKGIADVLYKTDGIRKKREDYHKQRISFMDKYPKYSQFYLAKYSLALDEQSTDAGEAFNKQEWQRLNDKLNLQDIKSQQIDAEMKIRAKKNINPTSHLTTK